MRETDSRTETNRQTQTQTERERKRDRKVFHQFSTPNYPLCVSEDGQVSMLRRPNLKLQGLFPFDHPRGGDDIRAV